MKAKDEGVCAWAGARHRVVTAPRSAVKTNEEGERARGRGDAATRACESEGEGYTNKQWSAAKQTRKGKREMLETSIDRRCACACACACDGVASGCGGCCVCVRVRENDNGVTGECERGFFHAPVQRRRRTKRNGRAAQPACVVPCVARFLSYRHGCCCCCRDTR